MKFSKFAVLCTVATLAACSSDGDEDMLSTNDAQNGMGMDGTGATYGADGIYSGELGNFEPGSQEQLVAAIGDRVFFSFNSASLNANAQNTLNRQAEWLKQYDQVNVTIEGHCDERGTREYNLALGERRATAVKNYLVSKGISSARINVISYGKEHPEYLGANEAAWSKNRRSVTVVN